MKLTYLILTYLIASLKGETSKKTDKSLNGCKPTFQKTIQPFATKLKNQLGRESIPCTLKVSQYCKQSYNGIQYTINTIHGLSLLELDSVLVNCISEYKNSGTGNLKISYKPIDITFELTSCREIGYITTGCDKSTIKSTFITIQQMVIEFSLDFSFFKGHDVDVEIPGNTIKVSYTHTGIDSRVRFFDGLKSVFGVGNNKMYDLIIQVIKNEYQRDFIQKFNEIKL